MYLKGWLSAMLNLSDSLDTQNSSDSIFHVRKYEEQLKKSPFNKYRYLGILKHFIFMCTILYNIHTCIDIYYGTNIYIFIYTDI